MNRYSTQIGFSFILSLLVLLLGGCIEEIEFRSVETESLLVVQGRIHDGPGPYTVRLSRTAPYGPFQEPFEVGALVELKSGEGLCDTLFEESPGVYRGGGIQVQGRLYGRYWIEIELENGQRYASKAEQMPFRTRLSDIQINTIQLERVNDFGYLVREPSIEVVVSTSYPALEAGPFIRWKVDEVFRREDLDDGSPLGPPPKVCYITQVHEGQRINLLDGARLESNSWMGQSVLNRIIDWTFLQKHWINVYQLSLTPDAFDYWARVNRVVNQVGSIFDAPPAPVPGNIYNLNDTTERVLGYFEASAIDTIRTVLYPGQLGVPIRSYCEPNFNTSPPSYPRGCRDCLELEGSSLIRPDYF